jgi:hypothetical protein
MESTSQFKEEILRFADIAFLGRAGKNWLSIIHLD